LGVLFRSSEVLEKKICSYFYAVFGSNAEELRQSKPVLSNVFIYWGASDRRLWRRGRRVAIAIIIIII
jgi:hypothetical protein